MAYEIYNYNKKNDSQNNKQPENTHLIIEKDADTVYMVDASNNKVLLKSTDKGATWSTVETRTNKNIARIWHDITNGILYCADCEYDDSMSYVWSLDLSDDSVTEITSVPADVYDIFVYGGDLYMIYFGETAYEHLTDDINPDGDITTEWNPTPAGNHFSTIDEGSTPNTADYILSNSGPYPDDTDTFTMETIDMTGYDSAGVVDQVYQIKCWVYARSTSGSVASLKITGNKTGMTTKEIELFGTGWYYCTWNGLSLDQADLDDLEITLYAYACILKIQVYTMYCKVYFYGDASNAVLTVENITTPAIYTNNMGAVTGRAWDMSQMEIVGDKAYFRWEWSDENCELWHFDLTAHTFTEDEDLGSGTELPTVQQYAISYDEIDALYFVLGSGTAEVSTITADVPGNIDDGDYITYSAIELDYENERSEKDYYIWFDKVGDESGDPAPAGRTKITVDISACVTAQDVSDAIQSSVDAVDIITCANGGGTSTTCTLTCHYNGNTTNIADVDSGLAVATTTPGVDNTYYFYTYEITDDILTQKGEFNVALMMNRNTDSTANPPFNLEKAFSLDYTVESDGSYTFKVYQIANHRKALNYISRINLPAGSSIVAVTDHYLILDNNGTIEVWAFEDRIAEIIEFSGEHPILGIKDNCPTFDFLARDSLADYYEPGIFIQVIGTYSHNSSSTADQVVMEGYIYNHDEKDDPALKFWCKSQAFYELKQSIIITDYTNYTGKTTGQIITQLLSDYCQYIVAGTISGGAITYTCPDDWEARGDKRLFTIILELCESEDFIAKLRPTGELDIDDATVSTGVSIASTDQIHELPIISHPISNQINYVRLFGGIDPTTGKRVGTDTPITAEDKPSQQTVGIHRYIKTYAGEYD
ncbi:MAG: hypothetical protein ACFFG0_05600, partial [Candidatus Thorarchaeota archaeon]